MVFSGEDNYKMKMDLGPNINGLDRSTFWEGSNQQIKERYGTFSETYSVLSRKLGVFPKHVKRNGIKGK